MGFLRQLIPREFIFILSTPSFLYFSLSVFLSQIAYQMMNVSFIFLVYYLTGSNFVVSLLVLSFLIPQILFSFLGGIVADVRSKKKILVYGNIIRAMLIVFLFFNIESLYLVFIISILVSIITQFYIPAEPPFIPQLVAKSRLVAANSIFGISLFGSILIAFVLAGPLIQAFGRSTIFLIISFLFAISSFFALLLPDRKKTGPEREGSFIMNVIRFYHNDFLASTKLLRQKDNVGASFFLLIFSQVIILVLASVIPDYAESILRIPAENLSVILFAPAAVGMIIAGVSFGGNLGKIDKRFISVIGVFLSGFSLLFFPLTPHISKIFFSVSPLYVASVIAFLAGFANAFIFVPSQSTIQDKVPENFRSKVYGLMYAIVGVFSLIPIIVAGGVADVLGVGFVLSVLGFVILIVGILRLRSVVS